VIDAAFNSNSTRLSQLTDCFRIRPLEPECQDEYIKIPIDLPWGELQKDVNLAFDKFGWYGMIHRKQNNWDRSTLYGGLGLTYNPDYKFDLPEHAHALGNPRSTVRIVDPKKWIRDLESYNYSDNIDRFSFNTYADCLGLRHETDVTKFRSFPSVFEKIKRKLIQGRLAEIRPRFLLRGDKEFMWHTDEKNEFVSRLLIPITYSDDYFIEFKETGTKLYFEPGYAYHWNTYKVHRWNFNYRPNLMNRTCLVIGWAPWLEFDGERWSTNEYCNKIHPTDMINKGLVL
jgi:hypothetical protein